MAKSTSFSGHAVAIWPQILIVYLLKRSLTVYMAAAGEYVKLAQSLPPRLLRFFARYPPALSRPTGHAAASQLTTPLNTSAQDPNTPLGETDITHSRPEEPKFRSPFRSHKHPVTGVWHGPRFSLRQQADLVKLARANGVEELLPYSKKKTDVRLEKRERLGLRVKGTGEGQKVKGKKQERTMRNRLQLRRKAMLEMPEMIQRWKQVNDSRLKGRSSQS